MLRRGENSEGNGNGHARAKRVAAVGDFRRSGVRGRAALPDMRDALARGRRRDGKRYEAGRDARQRKRHRRRRYELAAMRDGLADRAGILIVERKIFRRRTLPRRARDDIVRREAGHRGEKVNMRLDQLHLDCERQHRQYGNPLPPAEFGLRCDRLGVDAARFQMLVPCSERRNVSRGFFAVTLQNGETCGEFAPCAARP